MIRVKDPEEFPRMFGINVKSLEPRLHFWPGQLKLQLSRCQPTLGVILAHLLQKQLQAVNVHLLILELALNGNVQICLSPLDCALTEHTCHHIEYKEMYERNVNKKFSPAAR